MEKVFLLLYVFIGLVPIFDAADKSSTQLLYLQIVNASFIVYFLFFLKKEKKIAFVTNLKSSLFILFLLFFCWAALSVSVAINKVESLKTLTLVATYLTTFPILYYLIHSINGIKGFFINLILTILSIEIFTVVSPFIYDLIMFGNFTYRSQSYSGLTGNVNIAAFSILMKLPFAFYKATHSKKSTTIALNSLLIFFGIYAIFSILSSRGAILGILLISLLLLIYMIFLSYKKNITTRILIKNILIIILPLIINLIINSVQTQVFSDSNQTDLSGRLETVADLEDTSNNSRLRYWKQSFMTGISNPIFGIGIGNWKLKGIETDNAKLVNYVVPYHSHNDFLEIFSETGLLGILFYGGFLAFILLSLIYFFTKRVQSTPLLFYLILAFIVYFMDSSLNFPFFRPIQQMGFLPIMIFSIVILKSEFGFDDSFKPLKSRFLLNIFWGGLILMAPFSLYSSVRIFNSSTQQHIMLGQFNLNLFNTPLSEIETFEMEFPNISETTIPLNSLKGIYYLKAEKFEKAIELFHKGRKANPYLMINESFLGYTYFRLNQADSAFYYSKKAFKYQPNNIAHFAHYIISLSMKKDSLEIQNAYNEIKKLRTDPEIDKIYYLSLSNLLDKDDSRQFVDNTAKNLLQSNETDDLTRVNLYVLEYGRQKVLEADILYLTAEKLFEEKNYLEAAIKFEEAAKINPLELPYFENAANAYMQISKLEKALENINFVIDNSKTPNGKAFYIKALIYIEKGDKRKACKLLTQAATSGFRGATNLSKAYCR
ncbi:O-antigen ligase family protein [Flavobacteriaceae bacterium]|nr:O-antigen ligase family protein [Flavobacteriaceae bacterium]